MQPPFWEIRLNVRSGLVSGLLEAIAILIFAPLITRATTQVYDALTTRRVLQGTPVKTRDNSLSVEDIIPRVIRVIRTASNRNPQVSLDIETPFADVTRQLLPLVTSAVMSVAIVLTSSFIDGTSIPVYTTNRMFLWNGDMFVDATSTGVNVRAGDIRGMAGVQRACVEREDNKTFNLYAAAFSEPQDFRSRDAANDFVCVNGRDTKQRIGVTIETDGTLPTLIASGPLTKDMEGVPANFTFLKRIHRAAMHATTISKNNSSTNWTFGSLFGPAYATRATVDASDIIITLRTGVAYVDDEFDDIRRCDYSDEKCKGLSTELLTLPQVTATITTIGIQQDLRQLELVVIDLLENGIPPSYTRVELQDILLRSYFAGASFSYNFPEETSGTFVPHQIETTTGTKQITTISGVAVIGFVSTIVGCFISFLVLIFVRPTERVTSVSYISRLYSGRDAENEDSDVMSGEVEYIGTDRTYDGSVYAAPVQVKRDYVP